jgi:hypothetical protein
MKKIANILEEIDNLKKEAFIPNPQLNDPNSNPQLQQAYQQLQEVAAKLPPQAQQQLQQQLQQLQQLPADQQMQALGQLTQQATQAGGQGQGADQGGQQTDPNAQGQDPTSAQGGAPGVTDLDNQQITITLRDLLNIVSGGSHEKTQAKIHSAKRTAELKTQLEEQKLQQQMADAQQKQQEAEAQKQQEAMMQQQANSPSNMMGGGLYPQPQQGATPAPMGQ